MRKKAKYRYMIIHRDQFLRTFLLFWRVGAVNLVVLACVLRATTIKVVNFFEEKSAPRRETHGCAYDL